MASPAIIRKIKTDLRIRNDQLDEDISDNIDSCVADLALCGIDVDDDRALDRNIVNAIKLYCRSRYTHDLEEAKLYEQRYGLLKGTLMMSEEYRRAGDDTDE